MTSRIRLAPRNTDPGDEQQTERCPSPQCLDGYWMEGFSKVDGSNYLTEFWEKCPTCHGAGRVSYWRDEGDGE